MTKHVASRTLVKSPPELWAECSDAASLARHLDQFGEIRITRLEPETAVAWEGERARGTVRIEPSGWGTKVILTAVAVKANMAKDGGAVETEASAPEPVEAVDVAVAPEPLEEPEPPVVPADREEPESPHDTAPPDEADSGSAGVGEPVQAIEPPNEPPARRRRFARLFGLFRAETPEPVALDEPVTQPAPTTEPAPTLAAALTTDPAPTIEHAPTTQLELQADPEPAPERDPTEARATELPATEAPGTEAALTAALDSLGQAHHRPYSRA